MIYSPAVILRLLLFYCYAIGIAIIIVLLLLFYCYCIAIAIVYCLLFSDCYIYADRKGVKR